LPQICNWLVSGVFSICHDGAFSDEFLGGDWSGTVSSPWTFCSGGWSAKPATRLYPRFDGSQRFLSTEESPSGQAWSLTLDPGVTHEWTAVLDDSLKGDVVTFKFALRGDDGTVAVALRPNESTYAWFHFDVTTEFLYHGRTDWTKDGWSDLQAEPGQELSLWITYQGTGHGGLLYGDGYESSVVVVGRVAVSPPAASPSAPAAGHQESVGRAVEVGRASGVVVRK
jgi:hypothetical protein